MKKTDIRLITDSYWPSSGGVEEAVRQCAALLPERFTCSIVTHPAMPKGVSLYQRTAVSRPVAEYRDPAGCIARTLQPAPFGAVLLLPYLLWNLPLARRVFAPLLFDRLYTSYRAAFFSKLKTLLFGADVVHCFSTGHLARLTADVCSRLKIPVVQNPYIHFGHWGDSPAQLSAYSRANAIICPTEHFKQRFRSISGADTDTVTVIPPIIADLSETPLQEHIPEIAHPFILFLGRRERHKGLPLLCEAFHRLTVTARLVIAGPGTPSGTPDDRIIDLGAVDEAMRRRLLAECDCFCMPSEDETFGIVYAEAMSCGKPVVALNTPPLPEIVEHGVTGFLTPPGDAASLAESLSVLLSDHDLRTRMGAAARARFESFFSGAVSMKKMVSLYDRLTTDRT